MNLTDNFEENSGRNTANQQSLTQSLNPHQSYSFSTLSDDKLQTKDYSFAANQNKSTSDTVKPDSSIKDTSSLDQSSRSQDNGNTTDSARQQGGAGGIRCLIWNMDSLFDKISLQGICDFIGSFHVACLAETFTLPNFDFNIKFDNFIQIHCPAEKFTSTGRPSGGLVVLIKKELEEYIKIIQTNISHILCFKLKKELLNSSKDLLFISSYVHPTNSIFYSNKEYDNTLDMLDNFLAETLIQDENVDILIGGDLNSRLGDWCYTQTEEDNHQDADDEQIFFRTAQDGITNPNGRKLIETCNTFNLTPLSGLKQQNFDDKYTFISSRGNSTIDHFLCSPDFLKFITQHRVLNRIESQHLPVSITISTGLNTNNETATKTGTMRKFKWQQDKAHECTNIFDKPESGKIFQEANLEADTNNIDQSINLFTKLMQKISKPMESVIQFGRKVLDKPWFDKECVQKKRETTAQLTKLTRVNNRKQPKRYQKEKRVYINKKLEYQKLIKDKRKVYNKKAKEKLINDCKDSRSFWSTIRKLNARKIKWPNITIQQWQDHYTKLFNSDSNKTSDQPKVETHEQDVLVDELDQDIGSQELDKAFKKLKKDKATGVDEISAEILIHSKNNIKPYLIKIFNKIFQMGYFPIYWGIATIVPLFKKGDRDLCDNYRGISLLSITSKLFTSIINNRLYNWAEDNQKINEEQAGFRRNYSTVDHIYTLHCMASNCLYGSKRSKLYAAFIDFQKAFDTVNRDKLWDILKKIGVSTKMINILKAIYQHVKAIVRQGHERSGEINCPQGVRQGCMLSPLLFSLLVAEVAHQVAQGGRTGYQMIPGAQEIFALLFADDIVLLSLTPAGLQTQLNNLRRAAENLGLIVNLNKSAILVFRKGAFLGRLEKWHYGDLPIQVVNSYKYLGFTMTTKLSLEIPLAEFAGRAKNKTLTIFKTLYKLGKIEPDIFFRLFDSQVKPMLIYAAEVWGLASKETFQTIEKVHMYACKRMLGVTPRTPNTLVQGELNRHPLSIDAKLRAVKYWGKLTQLDSVRLPRQAYERELKETTKPGNWAESIKRLLTTNGFAFIWESEGFACTKAMYRNFKQTLIDQFWQNWHDDIQTKDRYDMYRTLKLTHQREHYVDTITITKFRRAFARLRLGITNLRNNDRFLKPYSSTYCLFCFDNIIENEEHFLLQCPTYSQIREKYLLRCWITLKNVTITDLLANDSVTVTRCTSMFIFHATKLRDNLL